MKLNDYLEAGGPGSGRRPGYGAYGQHPSKRQPGIRMMHQVAKEHGFVYHDQYDNGTGTYSQTVTHLRHPDTGHQITISRGPGPGENFWRLSDKDGNHLAEDRLPRNDDEKAEMSETIDDHLQGKK